MKIGQYLGMLAAGAVWISVVAQTTAPTDRYQIPPTVSAEAAAALQRIYAGMAQRPAAHRPASDAEWDQRSAQLEALYGARSKQVADMLGVSTTADRIGNVPVIRIKPANYKPGAATLLYIHGGAFVGFSAASTLMVPALFASSGGGEVISIDYSLAPHATWRSMTDEILAVWRGVLASGKLPVSLGLAGDSAGGSLAAGSVLKMRDQGLPLPGMLWLLSPWSDITATGDSYGTLAAADPILNATSLAWDAEIYAPVADQKNPYVSPVYGDYSKAFPPTLIQVGTREIFLSNAVRQYQAIRNGGHEAVLDVYEGMPHVFQALIPEAPETRAAIMRAVAFFNLNLRAH